MPLAATRIYEMSFFTGFGVSALVYYSLNMFFPPRGKQSEFVEVDVGDQDRAESVSEEYEAGGGDVKKRLGSSNVTVLPVL